MMGMQQPMMGGMQPMGMMQQPPMMGQAGFTMGGQQPMAPPPLANLPPQAPVPVPRQANVRVQKPKMNDGDMSEEEDIDTYKYKERDFELLKKRQAVTVFCLKCEKTNSTRYKGETSSLQFVCCCLLLPTGLCCLPFCCGDSCGEHQQNCDKCGNMLFKEAPGDEQQTQWCKE